MLLSSPSSLQGVSGEEENEPSVDVLALGLFSGDSWALGGDMGVDIVGGREGERSWGWLELNCCYFAILNIRQKNSADNSLYARDP